MQNTRQLSHNEWTAMARCAAFEKILVVKGVRGWTLCGFINQDSTSSYHQARGGLRVFSSLDTVASFLADLDVDRFVISQPSQNELF